MAFFSAASLKQSAGSSKSCFQCRLSRSGKKPFAENINSLGGGREKILIVTAGPEQGGVVSDSALIYLKRVFRNFGKDLLQDCKIVNAVQCPSAQYVSNNIDCCRRFLYAEYKKFKPTQILLFGYAPINAHWAHRWKDKDMGISFWLGRNTPDHDIGCWVSCLDDINELQNTEPDDVTHVIFKNRLQVALTKGRQELYPKIDDSMVNVITNSRDALLFLNKVYSENPEYFAFDYETTGVKPYKDVGHKIACVSFMTEKHPATAFMMTPSVGRVLSKILIDKNIKKIAHNLKFEDTWSNIILGCPVNNWHFDCQIASNWLYNLPGANSLKFLNMVVLGVPLYNEEIQPYFDKVDDQGLNAVFKIPVVDLLTYCGMDSLTEFRLFEIFRKEIPASQFNPLSGYGLLHAGSVALAEVERNGLLIDVDYCNRIKKDLQVRIDQHATEFWSTDVGKTWKMQYFTNANINSNTQLSDILYHKCNLKPKRAGVETIDYGVFDDSDGKTDKMTLSNIDNPCIAPLLQYRSLSKALHTYIENFIVGADSNNVMHPSFNLTSVKTYRSSSSDPNFQNIPKRDFEIMNIVRSGIIARPGSYIAEADFSGLEVRGAAWYHKDKNMLSYLNDATKDMHRDSAQDIFLLSDAQVAGKKDIRNIAKGGFVFAEFYGSYYVSVAESLWASIQDKRITTNDGISVVEHLRNKGIYDQKQFEAHIQKVEHKFWNERFPEYRRWKFNQCEEYKRKGIFKSLTGFIYRGVYNKRHVTNYPVQGAAFHLLLWSLIQLHNEFKNRNLKSFIVGQIHDSLVFNIDQHELEEVLYLCEDIMTVKVNDAWRWINSPLSIEIDLSPMGGSWNDITPIAMRDKCPECGYSILWSLKDKVKGSYQKCVKCNSEVFR